MVFQESGSEFEEFLPFLLQSLEKMCLKSKRKYSKSKKYFL